MNKVVSIFKRKSTVIMLFLFLFMASAIIVLAMSLGNEAGQFVIQVKNDDVSASISLTDKSIDLKDFRSSLAPKGVTKMSDYTPSRFLESNYETLLEWTDIEGDGYVNPKLEGSEKYGVNLYVYTFYIVNTGMGSGAVPVHISMNYSKVTNHLDEIVRVMTFCRNRPAGESPVCIYQKPDQEYKQYEDYDFKTKSFAEIKGDSGTIFDDERIVLDASTEQKTSYIAYSVLFWLEGQDPESDRYGKELYGGTIKYEMNLEVGN